MTDSEGPLLSVLMPVYNEAGTVAEAIRPVVGCDALSSFELIVVDDGSTDGTREYLRSREWPADARVLFHERNRGKGAAVRTALAQARGEISAIFDADLDYDPEDLAQLLEPITTGDANTCFGVRVFEGTRAIRSST